MEKLEKRTQSCEFKVLENLDEVPEHIKSKVKDGELLVVAETLDSSFLPEKWQRELAEDTTNQRILWRHKDPENKEPGHVYGRVIEEEVVSKEDKLVNKSYNRIFTGPDGSAQKKFQEYLKTAKPKDAGWSKGFLINRDKNGDIYRVFSLENSVTYKPAYKDSQTIEVYQMEQDEYEQKIKTLQDELNNTKLKLEERDAELKKFETKLNEMDSLIDAKEAKKLSLEDKVIKLTDKLQEFSDKFVMLEKKPYLEGLSKHYDADILELMESKDVDWLKNKLELKEKSADPAAQIQTKTLEEESQEHVEHEDVPKEHGNEVFRNNPELLKRMAKLEEDDKAVGLTTKEGAWY